MSRDNGSGTIEKLDPENMGQPLELCCYVLYRDGDMPGGGSN